MAATFLKTAGKAVIGAGAVYVTMKQGVWNNSNDGTKALDKFKQSVLPATSDFVDKIPSLNTVNNSILDTWNHGVKVSFSFLATTPDLIWKFMNDSADYILYQGQVNLKPPKKSSVIED